MVRFLARKDPTELERLNQFTTPVGLANDFPDIVIRDDNNAVFISDAQRVVDTYFGCTTVHGPGVLLFADFQNTPIPPIPNPPPVPPILPFSRMDLGATNLQCRCLTIIACETFDHFHSILRKQEGFTRTETEGFAYFTSDLSDIRFYRLYIGSLFEFPERNDFKSWFPSLEFAKTRTNQKLAAMASAEWSEGGGCDDGKWSANDYC